MPKGPSKREVADYVGGSSLGMGSGDIARRFSIKQIEAIDLLNQLVREGTLIYKNTTYMSLPFFHFALGLELEPRVTVQASSLADAEAKVRKMRVRGAKGPLTVMRKQLITSTSAFPSGSRKSEKADRRQQ